MAFAENSCCTVSWCCVSAALRGRPAGSGPGVIGTPGTRGGVATPTEDDGAKAADGANATDGTNAADGASEVTGMRGADGSTIGCGAGDGAAALAVRRVDGGGAFWALLAEGAPTAAAAAGEEPEVTVREEVLRALVRPAGGARFTIRLMCRSESIVPEGGLTVQKGEAARLILPRGVLARAEGDLTVSAGDGDLKQMRRLSCGAIEDAAGSVVKLLSVITVGDGR